MSDKEEPNPIESKRKEVKRDGSSAENESSSHVSNVEEQVSKNNGCDTEKSDSLENANQNVDDDKKTRKRRKRVISNVGKDDQEIEDLTNDSETESKTLNKKRRINTEDSYPVDLEPKTKPFHDAIKSNVENLVTAMKAKSPNALGMMQVLLEGHSKGKETGSDKVIISHFIQTSNIGVDLVDFANHISNGKPTDAQKSTTFHLMELVLLYLSQNWEETDDKENPSIFLVKQILHSHIEMIKNSLLYAEKSSHIKAVFKLLIAMVIVSPSDVAGSLNLSPALFNKHLRNRDPRDPQDVRTCLIHYILSFLMFGDATVVRQLCEKRELLTCPFPGLKDDDASLIELFLKTVLEKIVRNPVVTKTTKVRIFHVTCLKTVIDLLQWKGPVKYSKKDKYSKNENKGTETLGFESPHAISDQRESSTKVVAATRRMGLNLDSSEESHMDIQPDPPRLAESQPIIKVFNWDNVGNTSVELSEHINEPPVDESSSSSTSWPKNTSSTRAIQKKRHFVCSVINTDGAASEPSQEDSISSLSLDQQVKETILDNNSLPIRNEAASHVTLPSSESAGQSRPGTTKLLLTKIPFYKEVVLMSFFCPHCNWSNNELQPASKMQEEGLRFELKVACLKDLSRQVVKTEWATVSIPELEFEIPSRTQEGAITTIEGIIQRTIEGLNQRIDTLKKESDADCLDKYLDFIKELNNLLTGEKPFTFILNDPSGNSYLENFMAPKKDPQLLVTHYIRSRDEDRFLGIFEPEEEESTDNSSSLNKELKLDEEVLMFQTNCSYCNAPCDTNMKLIKIPNFKETIIMATNCSACGHKTNEVKSGGGSEPLGTKITLKIESERDLTRDVLKSETCNISIPEIELEVGSHALGGRFTTVEGLLENVKEQLSSQNILIQGDSADSESKRKMEEFLAKIDEIVNSKIKATMILDDPCGNSYIENIHAPNPDPLITIEKYERTFEQNEELGFNDMKTENYSN